MTPNPWARARARSRPATPQVFYALFAWVLYPMREAIHFPIPDGLDERYKSSPARAPPAASRTGRRRRRAGRHKCARRPR